MTGVQTCALPISTALIEKAVAGIPKLLGRRSAHFDFKRSYRFVGCGLPFIQHLVHMLPGGEILGDIASVFFGIPIFHRYCFSRRFFVKLPSEPHENLNIGAFSVSVFDGKCD